jgi:hypothetical protein
MKSQKAAKGITLIDESTSYKMYKSICICGNDDCSHFLDVQVDDHTINLTIYNTLTTNFWSKTRWYHIWQLLVTGKVKSESTLVLDKQMATNYAHAILSSIDDLENSNKIT